MKLEIIGQLKFKEKTKEWIGSAKNFINDNLIELVIEANDSNEALNDKLKKVEDLFFDYERMMLTIYQHVFERYSLTQYQKSYAEITTMYFLSAVTLKIDQSWWIVLEPNWSVESVYNYFLRFTILNKEIAWSNI